MHNLLPLSQRIFRIRGHVEELRLWQYEAEKPVEGWRFNGAPIAVGAPWPTRASLATFDGARFEVPADWPLEHTRLDLDFGGEANVTIAFADGSTLLLGNDPNHRLHTLRARAGAISATAVPHGLMGRPSPSPALAAARLVRLEPTVARLALTLSLIADAASAIGAHEAIPALLDLADHALAQLRFPTETRTQGQHLVGRRRDAEIWKLPDWYRRNLAPLGEAAVSSAKAALSGLEAGIAALQQRYPAQGAVALVGHAHIDLAWLWPYAQTRRKVWHTMASAADLIDRAPHFRFTQSFAAYYADLEESAPDLFASIERHAKAGGWAPIGGFWVEMDTNMPTGESFARQALYGQRLFKRLFGHEHIVGWLPDTFGYSPALPQILRQAGMKAMFSAKLGWSETDRFPHTMFDWEGIDGTRVFVHAYTTSDNNYNGLVTPTWLHRVWNDHTDKHLHPEVLQPIGYGDGGGGPTDEMVASADILSRFPVMPRLRFATPNEFFEPAIASAQAGKTPVWVGELYLEFHRGTLTSQGRTKRLHRQAEHHLIGAETLRSLAHLAGAPAPASQEPLWRKLMVNQFHDILPGSSIAEVHVQTEGELAEVVAGAANVAADALKALGGRAAAAQDGAALVANPHNCELPVRLTLAAAAPNAQKTEEGWVVTGAQNIAPLSTALVTFAPPPRAVSARDLTMENEFVRVTVGEDGALHSLFDKRSGRELLAARGNQIWIYQDHPRVYEAWDIEENYELAGDELRAAERPALIEEGPHRAAIRVRRRIGKSEMTQSIRLWANSPRLDFATDFNWHDRRTLVKARFPFAIRADLATFECAFGVVRRPTHRNTSWDAARFEAAGHRFADISEPGAGVALLNDGRYGHHVRGGELGLSLLRAPSWPDIAADEGAQSITYALVPHGGDWFVGGVLAEASDLNRPLYAMGAGPGATATSGPRFSGLPVALGALKPAEDGDGLIVRVYEPQGARGAVSISPPDGWVVAERVDILERPWITQSAELGPFEIAAWRLRRK